LQVIEQGTSEGILSGSVTAILQVMQKTRLRNQSPMFFCSKDCNKKPAPIKELEKYIKQTGECVSNFKKV